MPVRGHEMRGLLVAVVLLAGCTDHKQKVIEAQKEREEKQKAFEKDQEAKKKAALPKFELAQLDAPWGDPGYVKVSTGKPCPEELWSVFPETPGEGATKEANEAKRADLSSKAKSTTYFAVLPLGTGVTFKKYNAKKKILPVEIDGAMECYDKLGLLSLAWGEPAKPFREKNDEEAPQSVWRARPVIVPVSFPNAAAAKAFTEKEGMGIDARVVFTLGKADVDKHPLKMGHMDGDGGNMEGMVDFGAGRLAHVNLVGIRLGLDHEKTALAEQLKKK